MRYYKSKSVAFQDKILELCLTIYENYPDNKRHISSELVKLILKALQANTDLVYRVSKHTMFLV